MVTLTTTYLLLTAIVAVPPKNVCFRGRSAAACRWFLITEARYNYRLNASQASDRWAGWAGNPLPHYLLAEAGLMRNTGASWAIGVTLWGGHDFGYEAAHAGVSARARRWLEGGTNVEGSLGLAYTSKGIGQGIIPGLGAAGRIDWNLRDLVSLGLRVEWLPEGRRCPPQYQTEFECVEVIPSGPTTGVGLDRTEAVRVWRVYAAVGAGSKPGVVAWLGAGVLGLLAATIGDCCSIN